MKAVLSILPAHLAEMPDRQRRAAISRVLTRNSTTAEAPVLVVNSADELVRLRAGMPRLSFTHRRLRDQLTSL